LFGAWVKAERTRRRLSQQALADLVGVKQAQISKIELSQRTNLTSETIRGLAQAFQLPVTEVMRRLVGPERASTLAELQAENVPIDVVEDLAQHSQDLLDEDWQAVIDLARRLAIKNAAIRRAQPPARAEHSTHSSDAAEPSDRGRATARGLNRMRA
jgi:transcriptional regulator with XRE-family HTH domain